MWKLLSDVDSAFTLLPVVLNPGFTLQSTREHLKKINIANSTSKDFDLIGLEWNLSMSVV